MTATRDQVDDLVRRVAADELLRMYDAVIADRDELRAEVDRLRRQLADRKDVWS